MRWKHNIKGDKKTVRQFAWLPVHMDDGITLWWEHYTESSVYTHWSDGWDGELRVPFGMRWKITSRTPVVKQLGEGNKPW